VESSTTMTGKENAGGGGGGGGGGAGRAERGTVVGWPFLRLTRPSLAGGPTTEAPSGRGNSVVVFVVAGNGDVSSSTGASGDAIWFPLVDGDVVEHMWISAI